jgi:hypothetical protein
MTTQSTLMIVIVFACVVSALDWFHKDAYASGVAFLGFGLGYIGLAILFRSTQ